MSEGDVSDASRMTETSEVSEVSELSDDSLLDDQLTRLSAVLAEALVERVTDVAPPPELRDRVLGAALAKRAPGRAASSSDAHADDPVAAFRTTIVALEALLDSLGRAEWDAPTIEGWTVKDLVSHLIEIETYFGSKLGLWQHDTMPGLEHDHLAMTRPAVEARADIEPSVVLAEWRTLVRSIMRHLDGVDRAVLDQRFSFHTLDLRLRSMLITRTFEVWTHDEDIRRAVARDLEPPDAARLRQMTKLAVASLPLGMSLAGVAQPGRRARVVLTGPGGGTWTTALALGERPAPGDDASSVTITAEALSFCRLAAKRLSAHELAAHIEGDAELAEKVLVGAAVFSA